MKNGSYSKKITPQSVLYMKRALNSSPSLLILVSSGALLIGLLFFIISGQIDLRYNSKNSQDVYTTGIVMSKWENWETRRGEERYSYKFGIIYSLNPDQPISSTMLQKVKKSHDRKLRGRNVDIEKFRKLSKLYAKSNNIKQEDLFYEIMRPSRTEYRSYNVNDVLELEYLSTQPWFMEGSLDATRELNRIIFRYGIMLLLLGSLGYFIDSFNLWKRYKIQ